MSLDQEKEVELAIVLLAYNNKDLIEEMLPSIIEHTDLTTHKLYLVDNGSSDGTTSFMEDNYPNIDIIRIEVNKGFTNGYIQALKHIKASYYALLSSDVEVTENWTAPVLDLFKQSKQLAAIQPKIKAYKQRSHFEYAGASGGYIDKHGYPFCRGRVFETVEEDTGQYDGITEIFWASGACFFVRASAYHQIGGFDNDYFAHMEEIDLCWRMRNAGWKIMACPKCEVYHIGGAVINYGSLEKVFRNHRNNLILLLKNLPKNELWKIPLRWLMDILAFIKLISAGNIKGSYGLVMAHFSFIKYLPKGIKSRRETQSNIKLHDKSCIFDQSIVWQYFVKRKYRFNQLKFTFPKYS